MPTDDEWMRELLEDSVSDVAPRERLEEIRARTLKSRPRRAWPWAAGTAVVATAATVAAVALIGGGPNTTGSADHGFAGSTSGGQSSAAEAKPSSPATAATPASPIQRSPSVSKTTATDTTGSQPAGSAATHTVPVYFFGQTPHGMRLYREFQKVTGSPARAAAQAAVSGTAADPDYRSPWPAGAKVTGVTSDGSTITVSLKSGGSSLADRPTGMSRSDARLAVQQVVYTVQGALSSTAPVTFTLDGKPASTLLGVDVSGSVKRASSLETESIVWVTSPVEGQKVHSPFKVTGLAATFEANVLLELKQNGHVVKQAQTTAHQAYVMSPYHFTVHAPPGHYTLVVHDSDASGKGQVTEDSKDITVLP